MKLGPDLLSAKTTEPKLSNDFNLEDLEKYCDSKVDCLLKTNFHYFN